MRLPDLGEGGPTKRSTRRLALVLGALVVAVIAALLIYALAA
jgi:hypothetical protein